MRTPAWIVPVLLVFCTAAGVGGSRLLEAPSVTRTWAGSVPDAGSRTSVFVVTGVKCVDTAERAAHQLDDLPGVQRLEAFASRARLDVTYDPAVLDAAEIRAALEGPVLDPATGGYLFGLYRVIQMDGVEIESPNE